jgi:hypothetical protein
LLWPLVFGVLSHACCFTDGFGSFVFVKPAVRVAEVDCLGPGVSFTGAEEQEHMVKLKLDIDQLKVSGVWISILLFKLRKTWAALLKPLLTRLLLLRLLRIVAALVTSHAGRITHAPPTRCHLLLVPDHVL